jgi:hypothetical protein
MNEPAVARAMDLIHFSEILSNAKELVVQDGVGHVA